MVYDYISAPSLKLFVKMLNERLNDDWTPIWNTFNYEVGDEKSASAYTVIVEKDVKQPIAEWVADL
ncbi:hypothetical protein [Methanobacterium congolense]|uniref:Uncharacterized protein n=1 Tax=Methanobacterium congolense TaxID=118062 RepID=A0A1D3L5U5_9EURY|nr:hypothetical protein [Methanobacterium congolense]SCG86929.1 hypothetical protein MCBB_PMCBBP0019 [Methanobacterium congolense]